MRRPVWVFDPNSLRGVYANPAALTLWSAASTEELLSRDFSKMSPAALARTARLVQATANGEELSERWTFYPNGAPVTVQATISTHRLADGSPALLFEASFLEVEAEERRAVEALRHTSSLITLFNSNGLAIFSNPAAFSTYGLNARAFQDTFADPERAEAMLTLVRTGRAASEVCQVVTEGGERWRHLEARQVQDPVTGTVGVLLNEFDVTDRIRAEQARVAAEQKAAMAEARERFLTDMSHDLRTPLNAIIGFSQLLRTGGLPAQQAEQALRIHESGALLLAAVNEMIRLSESEGWAGEGSADLALATAETPPSAEDDGLAYDRPLRVLYIDDNEHNRALVTTILAAHGVECETADDGKQGCEAAYASEWDLILMDIQMPVMDGVQATRAIRASPAPASMLPILAVTANTLPHQITNYLQAGMNDCIAKPIDIGVLLSKITHWIDAPQEQRLAARL